MNFPAKVLPGVPSCTKSVTVRWRTGSNSYDVIKLRPNRDVLINGDPPAVLPLWIDGLVIRHASSVFLSGSHHFDYYSAQVYFLIVIASFYVVSSGIT